MGAAAGRHRGREDRRGRRVGPGPGEPHDGGLHRATRSCSSQRGILLATSNNGDIDLSTPTGVLTATIKTAVSEHEVAMMRIRMKRAARQKAEQGIPKWKRRVRAISDDTPPARPDHRAAGEARRMPRSWPVGRSPTSPAPGTPPARYGLTGKPWTASTCQPVPAHSRATPGCAAHNGRDRRQGHLARRWWTNRPGGQRKPCSTRQGARRAARRCAAIC